jgi:NADP-dependent 3-hydroxy acid dehydrogenase YdfG
MDKPVAVITGASSGIGHETFRQFAISGLWTPIGIARRENRLQALVDEVGGEFKVCDITDEDQVDAATSEILDEHPGISVLVNNAGPVLRKRYSEATLAEVRSVMDTNYFGTISITNALKPGLDRAVHAHGRADIVNVVSAAAGVLDPNSGPYGASKSALLDYTMALMTDLRPEGIRVHAILPGRADTEGHPKRRKPNPSLMSKLMSRLTETDVDAVAEAIFAIAKHPQKPSERYLPGRLRIPAVANTLSRVNISSIVSALYRDKS